MCLYPKTIENPKYKPNDKNKGNIPRMLDPRLKYIEIPCGKCYQCRKQKGRDWAIRMSNEMKRDRDGHFVLLTISDKWFDELKSKYKLETANEVAKKAVRLTLARVIKKTGKSVKHWLVTELGHTNTERIHMHGIIWNPKDFLNAWKDNSLCNDNGIIGEAGIQYTVKYMTKLDTDHREYKAITLCSSKLGNNWLDGYDKNNNIFKGKNTNQSIRMNNGCKVAMPIYYRNKIYNDREREKLRINKLNENIGYIGKWKYRLDNHIEKERLLEEARHLAQEYENDDYYKYIKKNTLIKSTTDKRM